MAPTLSVVANHRTLAATAGLGQRIRQLQTEARRLAHEHIAALEAGLIQVQQLALEIAEGGEAYPTGVREVARRLGEESAAKAQTIEAILARTRPR